MGERATVEVYKGKGSWDWRCRDCRASTEPYGMYKVRTNRVLTWKEAYDLALRHVRWCPEATTLPPDISTIAGTPVVPCGDKMAHYIHMINRFWTARICPGAERSSL